MQAARRINVATLTGEQRDFVRSLHPAEAPVVLEEDGRPLAAVVPPWHVDSREENRRKLIELMSRLREANKDISDEQIEADIEAAIREIRKAT